MSGEKSMPGKGDLVLVDDSIVEPKGGWTIDHLNDVLSARGACISHTRPKKIGLFVGWINEWMTVVLDLKTGRPLFILVSVLTDSDKVERIGNVKVLATRDELRAVLDIDLVLPLYIKEKLQPNRPLLKTSEH